MKSNYFWSMVLSCRVSCVSGHRLVQFRSKLGIFVHVVFVLSTLHCQKPTYTYLSQWSDFKDVSNVGGEPSLRTF